MINRIKPRDLAYSTRELMHLTNCTIADCTMFQKISRGRSLARVGEVKSRDLRDSCIHITVVGNVTVHGIIYCPRNP